MASFMYEGRKFNDGQFNNDGTLFVLVDERGSLLIFSMGLTREAYSQAPVEQFFPVDFGHVTYDGGNNPLDTVTLLPIHLSARTGSKNINGIPNAVICPNYGLDFGTEQSEIDFGYEKCDVERFLQEEYQSYLLEKSNPSLPTATDMENKIKRRKKLKFEDIDEVQEVALDDAQTIRDFVNAYDSASDEAFTETTAAYISPEQLRRRKTLRSNTLKASKTLMNSTSIPEVQAVVLNIPSLRRLANVVGQGDQRLGWTDSNASILNKKCLIQMLRCYRMNILQSGHYKQPLPLYLTFLSWEMKFATFDKDINSSWIWFQIYLLCSYNRFRGTCFLIWDLLRKELFRGWNFLLVPQL